MKGYDAAFMAKDLDSEGLETPALIKMPDGTWKIRHSHTSSRPRRLAQ